MSFTNLKEGHWTNKIWSRISHDFNLNSVPAHHFYCSEWEILPENGDKAKDNPSSPSVSLPYLIYRGVFMLILLSSITFSTSCQSHLYHLFLTNWSFTSQTLYGTLFFLNVLWRWWIIKKRDSNSQNCQKQAVFSSSSSLLSNQGHCNNAIILEMGAAHQNSTPKKIEEQQMANSDASRIDGENKPQIQPDVYSVEPVSHENGSVSILTNVVGANNVNNGQNGQKEESFELTIKQDQYQESRQNLNYLEKAIWILMNVVHVLPYCVVLGYWCVVYKYDPDQPICERVKSHFIAHGGTAVLAFLDAMIIGIPARPTHFIFPTGLVLFYVLFTCVWEAVGGPYRTGKTFIYSVLDWKSNPQKAVIFSVMAVIATPIAHAVFCWGIYKLRMVLKSMYLKMQFKIK